MSFLKRNRKLPVASLNYALNDHKDLMIKVERLAGMKRFCYRLMESTGILKGELEWSNQQESSVELVHCYSRIDRSVEERIILRLEIL